ncbi:hypothetical protein GGI20_000471 [Coemansia sp. BCRC 34301]|nr:hypothetical protein GGI20_000471 [Coemansia sp. BCRC 34301]
MEASFYSGHATKWLSQALVDGCVFPLVRVLTICIAPDKIDEVDRSSVHYLDGAIDPKTVDGNINACVQLVKEMMPMLNEVRLEFERGLRLSGHIRRYTNRLISQLFRLANRIDWSR